MGVFDLELDSGSGDLQPCDTGHRVAGLAEESQTHTSQLWLSQKRIRWLQLDIPRVRLVCTHVQRGAGHWRSSLCIHVDFSRVVAVDLSLHLQPTVHDSHVDFGLAVR